MLRPSKQYKGIMLNKQTFKVSRFADNVAIFFNRRALEFDYVFDLLNAFGQKSSCIVNMNKSNAFYLGSNKSNVSQLFSVKGFILASKFCQIPHNC